MPAKVRASGRLATLHATRHFYEEAVLRPSAPHLLPVAPCRSGAQRRQAPRFGRSGDWGHWKIRPNLRRDLPRRRTVTWATCEADMTASVPSPHPFDDRQRRGRGWLSLVAHFGPGDSRLYGCITGIVAMVKPPDIGAMRRPSGAIRPPEGVSNSRVPRTPAVTAQPPEDVSVNPNDV